MAALTLFDPNLIQLEDGEFPWFAETIFRLAGIKLSEKKRDLVTMRLQSKLLAHGYKTFTAYREFLEALPPDHAEWQTFVNLLTTNKTDFFREPRHFDYLVSNFLPAWLESGGRSLRVWSCACSTGEEPYTLAMVLAKHVPEGRDFQILASDVDTNVLKTAANGVYPNSKLPEIPEEYHSTCLDFGKKAASGWFRIRDELQRNIEFRQHNLVTDPLPTDEKFDLILCRNVLIYFSRDTIRTLMLKLHSATAEKGQLFIGHSESIHGLEVGWKSVRPSVYRKLA